MMRKYLVTPLAALVALSSLAVPVQADDKVFLDRERAHAISRLDTDQRWLSGKIRELFGCDRDCQIDKKIEEIRNEPVGSLGIRA